MSGSPSPVLGVDAGGSGCRALLVSAAGVVLGRAEGGPAQAALAPTTLAASLGGMLAELGQNLQGPPRGGVRVVAGFAGAAAEQGRRRARRALGRVLASGGWHVTALTVVTDLEVVLAAAADPGEPAAVLLASTGSVAVACGASAPFVRVGGWGRYLGDEGSGFWLGWRALGAVLRSGDGRPPESHTLAPALLGALGLASPSDLAWAAQRLWTEPARVAGLAPLVLAQAQAGDPAATDLVAQAATALAELLLVARHRSGVGPEVPSALAGGLWRADACSGGVLERALRSKLPVALADALTPLRLPPVAGAVCLGLEPSAARTLRAGLAAEAPM